MVSFKEQVARIKKEFNFNHNELSGLIIGMIVFGFIFSFKYWGTQKFDWIYGLKNLVLITLAAGISLFAHVAPQKIYALSLGYKVEFRTWWLGILISLVFAFATFGNLTLVLAGSASAVFMVRHRLGQFRYGFQIEEQALIAFWGVLGSLIMAMGFRIGNYFFSQTLFFERGMIICLIFAICSVLPIPRLEGLNIFFGSREIYGIAVVTVLITTLLLLLGGGWGLLLLIILGILIGG